MSRILDVADLFTSATTPSAAGSVSVVATQSIASAGQIALSTSALSVLKVQGDSGAQDASTTPFSGTPIDGQLIIIEGQSNTNTLTIAHNDASGGCILNGDRVLGQYDNLVLYYDETALRYKELTRNS